MSSLFAQIYLSRYFVGAPVAQQVRRWPADLENPGSRRAGGGNLFSRKRDSIVHNLSILPTYRPDMTEILFKRT